MNLRGFEYFFFQILMIAIINENKLEKFSKFFIIIFIIII